MEYEDTNILRTQYVDDLVNQRQALEDAMLYQESPIVAGEGLNTMVPKVSALTGAKPYIPYINFFNIKDVSVDTLKKLNVYDWEDFTNFMKMNNAIHGTLMDLRCLYFNKPKIMKGMFSYRAGSIYTNKSFNCEYVENAEKFMGFVGTGYSYYPYYIYNEAPWIFKNLINANEMFANTQVYKYQNPVKVPSKKLESMFQTFMGNNLRLPNTPFNEYSVQQQFLVEVFESMNTRNVSDISNCFISATVNQKFADLIGKKDWGNVTNAAGLFKDASLGVSWEINDVIDFSAIYLPKVVTFEEMFYNIKYARCIITPTVPNETLETMEDLFNFPEDDYLTTIDLSHINMGKVNNLSYCFNSKNKITTIYFGYNYGKGFTTKTNNKREYIIDLTSKSALIKDSVLNIFNKLYDLNLTYDVANTGKLYTQKIDLHADVIAQLTPEEIAIATNKGWTVV